MKNHEQTKLSIIGFFYQYGISCDADESRADHFLGQLLDLKSSVASSFIFHMT
jgi:hypothetical protein